MAEIRNDVGAMRFVLALVARAGDEGGAPLAGNAGPAARLLATAGLDYLDVRDREWWPLVRLPPLRLDLAAVEQLRAQLAALLQGTTEGFAWRPDVVASVALQLGAVPAGALVEVGLDLGAFLADAAGVAPRSEIDLALFRFRALQQDLVRFADALAGELEALRT